MSAFADPTVEPTRSSKPLGTQAVVATGLIGSALLACLIYRLGPSRIATELHGLSVTLPAVLALTALKYPLQTVGWRLALPPESRPRWGPSLRSTIAGDAVGYLTWFGPLAAEPTRALLTRGELPVAAGIAAGATERAAYNVTGTSLVWLVLLMLLSEAHPIAAACGLVGSLAGIAVVVALVRRRRTRAHADMHTRAPRLSSKGYTRRVAAGIAAVHEALRMQWATRRQVLPAIVLLCVAQHLVLVGEAYLILRALDANTTIKVAFVFEAVTKLVNIAGMMVPARLGVAEGGSALLANVLGLSASHGLSLALLRRVRAVIWAVVGLAFLPYREAMSGH